MQLRNITGKYLLLFTCNLPVLKKVNINKQRIFEQPVKQFGDGSIS